MILVNRNQSKRISGLINLIYSYNLFAPKESNHTGLVIYITYRELNKFCFSDDSKL